jgi:hypothetical protein
MPALRRIGRASSLSITAPYRRQSRPQACLVPRPSTLARRGICRVDTLLRRGGRIERGAGAGAGAPLRRAVRARRVGRSRTPGSPVTPAARRATFPKLDIDTELDELARLGRGGQALAAAPAHR